MEKADSWKDERQKQVRKTQHRYQKSVKGKTEKDHKDCHKNVN